jgi:hypothetical protein
VIVTHSWIETLNVAKYAGHGDSFEEEEKIYSRKYSKKIKKKNIPRMFFHEKQLNSVRIIY